METDGIMFYEISRKVIEMELNRFNLDYNYFSTTIPQVTSGFTENFDVGYNRCAYMFRYGVSNLCFFKYCMSQFLAEYPNCADLLTTWKADQEISSISCGPGLELFGFMLAILEYNPLYFMDFSFSKVNILTKHGAWRNTVNFIADVVHSTYSTHLFANAEHPNLSNIKVIQDRSFSDGICLKMLDLIKDSHVVLMMKTLNLSVSVLPQENVMLTTLKDVISSLRDEAILFFIDTKPSLALLSQVLKTFGGKFLYGPSYLSIKVSNNLPQLNGCHPVLTSRGVFAVWQKLSSCFSTTIPPITSPVIVVPSATQGDDNTSILCTKPWSSLFDNKSHQDKLSEIGESMKNLTATYAENLDSQNLYKLAYLTQSDNSCSKIFKDEPPNNINTDFHGLESQSVVEKLEDEIVIDRENNSKNFSECHSSKSIAPSIKCNVNLLKQLDEHIPVQENFFRDQEPSQPDSESSKTLMPLIDVGEIKKCQNPVISESVISHIEVNAVEINAFEGNYPLTNALKENHNALVRNDSASKIVTEECTTKRNSFPKTSVETKVVQTDTCTNNETNISTDSIKSLTERIRNLVTLFESIAPNQDLDIKSEESASIKCFGCKNKKPNCNSCKMPLVSFCKECNEKVNCNIQCCDNQTFSHSGTTNKQKLCSECTKHVSCSREEKNNQSHFGPYVQAHNNSFSSDCSANSHNLKFLHNSLHCSNVNAQRGNLFLPCCSFQNRCCHQFYGCPMQYHIPQCHHPQHSTRFCESRHEEKPFNSAVANLVIPLQNIDKELLTQLISSSKTESH